MMDLCDYQNKTFTSDKVDDNYHTGEFGAGVHVCFCCSYCVFRIYCKLNIVTLNVICKVDEYISIFLDSDVLHRCVEL